MIMSLDRYSKRSTIFVYNIKLWSLSFYMVNDKNKNKAALDGSTPMRSFNYNKERGAGFGVFVRVLG